MAQREEPRRRGRPPLDPHARSVNVQLTLSARQYDELYQRASRAGVSVPEAVRRVLRHARTRPADDRDDDEE